MITYGEPQEQTYTRTKPKNPLIPDCPNCDGETELNGQGGINCFFCGLDTGSKLPESSNQPHPFPEREIMPVLTKEDGTKVVIYPTGEEKPLVDNLG